MTTMKEVAKYAQVSVATVSRVINGNGYVSPALQEKVRAAMETLNYHPSALARSLRRQQTMTIGVLVPQINHMFFGNLAFVIEHALFASGYQVLVCNTEEDSEKEDAYIESLLRQRVDGVILVPTGRSSRNIQRLWQQNIAVVLLDRTLIGLEGISQISSDNESGGYLGARHLLELGHRRIGVICTSNSSPPMIQRLTGVKRAFAEFGLEYDSGILVVSTLYQYSAGYEAVESFFEGPRTPTAVFSFTDVMALGVLRAAADMGLSVPGDLSIMGYDNLETTDYTSPRLTTISQPIHEMAHAAVQSLQGQMQGVSGPPETLTYPVKLIVRESTGAPGIPPKVK